MMSIELAMIYLISFIMVSSVLIGLIQGFRKSMFRFVATILFWVIFWITAPLVKGKIIWYNESLFASLSGLLPTVDGATNLMEYLKYTVAESAGMDVQVLSDPAFENTIIAIAQSLIKIIYLIVYAILFGIVRAIVYRVFFKKYCKINKRVLRRLEKKQNKYIERHNEPSPKLEKRIARTEKALKRNKIYRPLGLASGFLRGLLSSFLILCVVNSFVKLLPGGNKDDITASNGNPEKQLSLYDFILDYCGDSGVLRDAVEMIHDYQSSSLTNITGIKIGNKAADDLFIDSIISGKSEDYSFALRKELSSIIQIAENAYSLTNGFDMESVEWTALNDAQIQNAQNVLNILASDDLVNNLGSALVGVALSLDALSDYMPSELKPEEYTSIDWNNELTTIASLVSKVYGLGDDLSKLDFFALDTDQVESIFVELSGLKSINLLGHIGCSLGIKQLVGDNEKNAEEIKNIEKKLAELAVNDGFSETIKDYSTLYTQFISIFNDSSLEAYKDEDGKITNYVTALTSVNTVKYEVIVNTVLETNFISEILPDVLTIVRDNLIPQEYASLINPHVTTSSQVKNEINTVLTIIHDITTDPEGTIHPFETIEKYDFSLLRNFTTETVVQSELLSYAMIKLFVDTSKSEGILSEVGGEVANYVRVPDYLTTYDSNRHEFASKWYKDTTNNVKGGELYIMLDTIKDCASQIESINNPVKSLPAIIAAINANKILDSDVLYYTLNNLIEQNRDIIIVPLSETDSESTYTVNNVKVKNIIKRQSLKEVASIFTNRDIIDLEQLYAYYYYDAENDVVAETATPFEEIENVDDYVVKLAFDSPEKLFGLLTSKKLYDPEHPENDANLNKLFASPILRATLTDLLANNVGEYIVLPDRATEGEQQCLKAVAIEGSEEKEVVVTNVKLIKDSQFKSLIMAIDELDIDIATLVDNPLEIISCFETSDKQLKPVVYSVFGDNGYDNSKYNSILHATLSKYILDFSSEGAEGMEIVVPTEVLDNEDNTLISSKEIVSLIRSITIVGTEVFTDDTLSSDDVIDTLLDKIISNNDALSSKIILATLTNYIDDPDGDITIPHEAFDSTITSKNVVERSHIVDLLNALEAIKVERNKELALEGLEPINYSKLFDVNNLKVSTLMNVNKQENNPISKSVILRGILTTQIEKNDIEIPLEAKDGSCISIVETNSLISILGDIIGENSDLSNINVDDLKVGKLQEMLADINNSLIARKLVTNELSKQSDTVVMPNGVNDVTITSTDVIKKEELSNLVNGLVTILDSESLVSNIDVNTITVGKLGDAKQYISNSLILNATITKQLNEQDDVIVPLQAFENQTTKDVLKKAQMSELVDGLVNLLGASSKVSNIDVNTIAISDINRAKGNISNSLVLNATITKQLNDQEAVVVPLSAYENPVQKDVLKTAQMNVLIDGLVKLLGEETKVSNINVEDIAISDISNAKESISSSLVLNATITKQLKDQDDVVIPTQTYENETSKDMLTSSQMSVLIDGLVNLLGSDTKVSNIDVNKIAVSDISNAKEDISNSLVLNATITKQLNNQDDVVIPLQAYENQLRKEMLKTAQMNVLIDGLVNLLGSNTKVSNINVDEIAIADIKRAKNDISSSLVLNATITKQLDGQEDVVIPVEAYENETRDTLTTTQMNDLIDGLANLLGESTKVSNIDVNTILVADINRAKNNISNSSVLNATITKQLKVQNDVVIPSQAYKNADQNMLKNGQDDNEMLDLINGLVKLLGLNTHVNDIKIDNISLGNIKAAESYLGNSLVLNATVTKQLNDVDDVVVPSDAYDATGVALITAQMNLLIDGLVELLGENTKVNDIKIEDISIADIDRSNSYISNSLVLNATVTNQLKGQDGVVIPSATFASNGEGLTNEQMNLLIDGLVKLLGTSTKVNAINVNSITFEKIHNAKDDICGSLVLNATVTKQLKDVDDIVIPNETYLVANESLLSVQMGYLIDGLYNLVDPTKPVNNINVSTITVAKLYSGRVDIGNSNVLNATITSQLSSSGNDSIELPANAFNTTNNQMLKSIEIVNMLAGLNFLVNPNSTVDNIDIDSMKVINVKNSRTYINNSLVLRATITKNIAKQNSIVVPSVAYDAENPEMVTKAEINSFIDILDALFGENERLTSLPVDHLTVSQLDASSDKIVSSWILKATITDKINGRSSEGIIVPSISYDINHILTNSEISYMLHGLNALYAEGTTIDGIANFGGIDLVKVNDEIDNINGSNILRASVSKEILDVDDIIVLRKDIDTVITDYNVIKAASLKALFKAINCMNLTSFNSINKDNITVPVAHKDDIAASDIMRATITLNTKVTIGESEISIYALLTDASVETSWENANVLVLGADELKRMIDSISILTSGGNISVELNIDALIQALNDGKLDTIVSSNTLRMAISKYLCDGVVVSESNVSYQEVLVMESYVLSHPEYEFVYNSTMFGQKFYKFIAPQTYDVYQIPTTTPTTYDSISKEDIIAFVSYVDYLY